MIESLYFIAVGIVLYLVADKILDMIEVRRGARFPQRTVIFFVILLGLALLVFPLMQQLGGSGAPPPDGESQSSQNETARPQ